MVHSVEGWQGEFSGGCSGRASERGRTRGRAGGTVAALGALLLAAVGCGTNNTYYIQNVIEADPDAGAGAPAVVPPDEHDDDGDDGDDGAGGDGSMTAGQDGESPPVKPGTPLDGSSKGDA